MDKKRLDKACLEFISTRAKAQDAIKENRVLVNGKVISKASYLVCEQDEIKVLSSEDDFVSRAGIKLKDAMEYFHIDIFNQTVLDIGASTGGFTDVCIRHHAKKVYALDVGHLQLDKTLEQNPRVIKMEGFNARNITKDTFAEAIDFVCMDVSFISCKTILEVIFDTVQPTHMVILIKPQFECGPQFLNKNGVLKNQKVINHVLEDVKNFISVKYINVNIIPSSIKGRSGNQEYLCYAYEMR